MYDFRQEQFSKVFEKTYSEILNADLENGLYHISDEFYFDILVKNFEPIFLESEKIIICFSGAIIDRKNKLAPFFAGENIAATLRVPLIAFSDPQVSSSELNLAWYVGGKKNLDYVKKVVSFLKYISEKYKKELVFLGGSGGGFAALLYANLLDFPASCLVWNPQIRIENYDDVDVDKYINIAFENKRLFNSNLSRGDYFRKNQVYHDISELKENKKLKIIYLQNLEDKLHINNHLRFFMAHKKWRRVDDSTVFYNDTLIHYDNWGEGHAMPHKHIIQNLLEGIVNGEFFLNSLDNKNIVVNREKYKYENIDFNKVKLDLFPRFSFENGKLSVESRVFDTIGEIVSPSLSYACYLLYGDMVISKKMYQKSNMFEFDIDADVVGQIIVRCYILDGNSIGKMNNFLVSPKIYKTGDL